MGKDGKQSYYEVLDVSFNANPEIIRTAYIRAKNAYNRDSLAAYSLFDKEDSKRILDEIEEAYTILSDSEKRRKYDESHGIVSSESVYENYHRGNHAVAAFARDALAAEADIGGRFSLEQDPFRKQADTFAPRDGVAPAPTVSPAASASPAMAPQVSPVERLRAMQDLAGQNAVGPRSYQVTRAFEANPEMEERIKNCE
ncbi:MAG: DnaJ domain-containing protein, partial [Bdellovibrionota bacterium]